ncbi:MAG: hypothetical protein IPP20_22365 [Gemmatimonadetes bacterium]|nr:hypothetical protein [Gemmatimonadota bacterium]
MRFQIVALTPPLEIVSEVKSEHGVSVELRDSRGHEATSRYVEAARVDASYADLALLRDRLGDGWRTLGEWLTHSADSEPALAPSWYFDGCQPRRSYHEQSMAGPLGCYGVVVAVLFFFLPTLAAVLLGLGVVAGLLWLGGSLFDAVGSSLEARQDEKAAYLRVVTIDANDRLGLQSASGFARISPDSFSHTFSPMVVCYSRLADRLVLAAAESDPSRAARVVAAETLRQRRDVEERVAQTEADLAASREAAARIAAAEARRRKSP